MIGSKTISVLSAALMLCSTQLFGHPHNWIDLSSEFTINEQGRLTSFTQHWQFDQFFSMINYAQLMNEYQDESLGLASSAMKMVANVAPDQYFSQLTVAGKNIALSVPKLYSLEIQQVDGNPRLILKMHFSLKEQPLVRGKTFSLQTFEPSYFVAMNHLSTTDIKINSSQSSCKVQLVSADPSEDLISYANSLDRSMRDTQGLGENFAQRIHIKC
jgi:ABC-type uncharacterized transport system substrate-binding protein